MKEIEQLIALLRPDNLRFEKKDSRIKSLDKNIAEHMMQINKILFFEYKKIILKKTNKFLSDFSEKVLNSPNGKATYIYVKSYILKFNNEFHQFKDSVIDNKSYTSYTFESIAHFMNSTDNTMKIEKKLYSELDEEFKKYYQIYFDTVEIAIKRISSTIESIDINNLVTNKTTINNTNSPKPDKIKLNLSVGEIALLFRLLKENKTIIDSKSNADLFRSISTIFISKKTDNISTNSLKKKFLEPDSKTLTEIGILLTNLKTGLKKIK